MRRGRRLALLGAGIAVPLAAVVALLARGDSEPSACSRERVPTLRADLVASGPDPVAWGLYFRPVSEERLHRNRVQGGIVVQYGSGTSASAAAELGAWYRSDPVGLVVAPLAEGDETVRARSWAAGIRCRTFVEQELDDFRNEHRFRGPERVPRAQLRPAAAIRIVPQPVRGRATISFAIPPPGRIEVEIRTPSGTTVRRLGSFSGTTGQLLALGWDGRDGGGRRLRPGRYTVVVLSENRIAISAAFRSA